MADQETKVPSLEERLAYVLSRRGIQKFNKATMGAARFPVLSCIPILLRRIISDATPTASAILTPASEMRPMPKTLNTAN